MSADAVRVVDDSHPGDGLLTTLADLVEVDGQPVRPRQPPERLVLVEQQTRTRLGPGS